jgi:hypothetical protein
LEALAVQAPYLALHPGIKGLVGLLSYFFIREKLLYFLGVFDLLLVVLPLPLGDCLPYLGAPELFEGLVDLPGDEVALESPLLLPAAEAADPAGAAGFILFAVGYGGGYLRGKLGDLTQVKAAIIGVAAQSPEMEFDPELGE